MRTHRKDAGFSLAALIFFATAASIFIAAAVPAYQMQAKREMEAELIFRGEEYVRAIQKYQRKFGIYPTSIDQLVSTNGLRFLRRPYKDPFTEKEFRLITLNPDLSVNGSKLYQQNMGTQPLFGGNTQTFRPGQNSQQQGLQQSQQPGFPQAGQQRPGGQQQPGFQGQGFQSQGQQGFGQQAPAQQQQQGFGGGQQFQQGSQPRPQAGGTSGISNTLGGTQIAAGGIIGVASDSDKESIKVYNNRQKYDEWEFIAILGQQGPQGQPGQNPQPPNPNGPPNQLQNPNPFAPGANPAFQPRPGNPLGGPPSNPLGGPPSNSPFGPPTNSSFGPLGGPQGGGQRPVQNPFGFGGTPQQPQPGKLP